MKIIKLLNKKILSIFIVSIIFFSNGINAEDEPADIWNLEKKVEENNSKIVLENYDPNEIDAKIENDNSINEISIINRKDLKDNKINIVGLYDPEKNGLKIDMWSNSNGNEIKFILNKLNKINLSNDAKKILEIALLTNSYSPQANITEEEFINFKTNYLIKNGGANILRIVIDIVGYDERPQYLKNIYQPINKIILEQFRKGLDLLCIFFTTPFRKMVGK